MADFSVNIEIGTDYYSTFTRNDVSIPNAFRELIDNSTSSYFEHKDELNKIGVDICKVHIMWDDEKITVRDNAFGMNKEGFGRAFKLNEIPENTSEFSRNEYGMGLKYSALSLGAAYTVDTVEFNSGKRFRMTLDSSELKQSKPKELQASEFDTPKKNENHGTTITISKLSPEARFSQFNTVGKKKIGLKKLKTQLSYIYSYDLDNRNLELVINGEKVEKPEIQYYVNPETGAEVFKNIDSQFKFEGNIYKFSGFVGMLETGSVDNAGFSLIQKGRAIEINYRPESLFGKSNDFRYQRIYGEITLDGSNWEVTFTKSRIKISDEMREELNNAIIKCDGVKDVFDKAKARRSRNESNVKPQELLGHGAKKTDPTPNPLTSTSTKESDAQAVIPLGTVSNTEVVKPVDSNVPVVTVPEAKVEEIYISESYGSVDYRFYIQTENVDDMNDKWFKVVVRNKDSHEYDLTINTTVGLIKELSSSSKNKSVLTTLAARIALAQILSEANGLKLDSSQIMIDKINELISK